MAITNSRTVDVVQDLKNFDCEIISDRTESSTWWGGGAGPNGDGVVRSENSYGVVICGEVWRGENLFMVGVCGMVSLAPLILPTCKHASTG